VSGGKEDRRIITKKRSGVFVSSADTSVVFATNGAIASEFNDLDRSGWLVTGFMFALCATQPLVSKNKTNKPKLGLAYHCFQYGKMSDLYGRKSMLSMAYVLFIVGCIVRYV
jgi:MFS family permease